MYGHLQVLSTIFCEEISSLVRGGGVRSHFTTYGWYRSDVWCPGCSSLRSCCIWLVDFFELLFRYFIRILAAALGRIFHYPFVFLARCSKFNIFPCFPSYKERSLLVSEIQRVRNGLGWGGGQRHQHHEFYIYIYKYIYIYIYI